MKKFPQCMMCVYATGRRCNLKGNTISDEIYNNEVKCEGFKDLSSESSDVDDACCSETKRFASEMKKFEE